MCHILLLMPVIGLAVFLIWPLFISGPVYAFIFLLSAWMYYYIMKAMQNPITTGQEALLHSTGEIVGHEKGRWLVRVFSETWEAESTDELHIGDEVKVTGIEGLILKVQRKESEPSVIRGS